MLEKYSVWNKSTVNGIFNMFRKKEEGTQMITKE